MVRISARGNRASTLDDSYIQFNSDTASNYSDTLVRAYGSSAGSSRNSSNNLMRIRSFPAADNTANVFGSAEIYIPSYLANQNKPVGAVNQYSDTVTDSWEGATAGLWRNTAAITSMSIYPESGSFVSGSSFYLYGIRSS